MENKNYMTQKNLDSLGFNDKGLLLIKCFVELSENELNKSLNNISDENYCSRLDNYYLCKCIEEVNHFIIDLSFNIYYVEGYKFV